ncbi:antibiotic biosynthesis monooxygenase [Robbsia andropogonis]|uniref:Antibiotic biosynthesis monooxygenase n=2 Tax=Robbsia andropogonis TaxID=28092 RepID=A0A0F5JVG5_9BURK|nr:antibiotic biosynthesis monooxygenase [Robbsia andropogonis]KKB61861.1 antibiotic biosynthesis monooxygenase [Robbsia andropogonis]MCP1118658.1 antibiotic biosynthesis monooxygenase [Robbsia andropogonis]MCP1128125.1 antibiotic biosynthesis monooxygenase [Robbsia andropogonis]
MILEIAHFRIQSSADNPGFEAAFAIAQIILASMPGYLGHELHRCIEDPCEYRLLVHWNTVQDHIKGFRESARFAEWRALLQPFFAAPPSAAHYEARFTSHPSC